ncbi:MAG TPA: carboxypeptidase regulatory-like domain-containing protein, partial [Pyrinomonadaceae bacterium]|nr:carboxypeptidase regulatory-like domain-containing protein [Pyrinomonadaceae bacterium]
MKARRSSRLIAASALLAFSFALSHGARATTSVRSVARAAKSRAAVDEAVFDLRDFGAVGDGSTDDGPALQHALDALAEAGGGTLVVPEGKYVIATPVAKDFTGLASSLTIRGVESATTVDVNAAPKYLTAELGLVSEFYPRTDTQTALDIKGLQTLLVSDLEFVGTPDVLIDAAVTLDISDVEDATVRHCEFYGLSTRTAGGAILLARRSALRVEQTKFLGSFGASGNYTPDVQNLEWKGISFSDVVFADYGQRADIYCKCDYGATWAWVNVGNAAATTPLSPRREVVFRNLFLDEGGYVGLSSLPTWFQPPTAPIDLLYITGLRMNVSNFGTTGNYFENLGSVLIEDAQYGWSHNAGSAIGLHGVGSAIISRASLSDAATVITADAATGSLTVINSTYAYLDSQAQTNREITTQQPDADPVLYVREQFAAALGRDPDAAAHFYWSSLLLQCGDDADCLNRRRLDLLSYLGQQPQPNFAIAGVASDENGSPLAGVAVTLDGSQSAATETGADGSYRFANLPTSGVYTVNAAAPRHYTFASPSATFTTPPADVRGDFAATLKRHQIAGQLTDEQGRAIAGATLTLSGAQSAETTTDDEGNYSFPDLPEGAGYTVTPSSARYSFAVASQTFDDLSADAHASFAGISLFHSLGGRVVGAAGAGLPGVAVTLSGARSSTTTTDAAGNFSFVDLPRGATYTLTPSLRFYASAPASQTFDNLSADGSVVFNMSPATHTVGGRVTENGAGLGGVTVTLSGAKSVTAATDADGNYSFTNLNADGSYTVAASKTHYTFASSSQTFDGLDADARADFAATLSRHQITGRVLRQDGTGLAGATLTLSGSQSSTTTTDSGGGFSFTNLGDGGSYTVTPALVNYTFAPASKTFDDLGSDQTAAFAGTLNKYTVGGQVRDSSGKALAGVTLTLTGAQSAKATSDANGNYSLPNLTAGASYTITPTLTNYTFAPASKTFDDLGSDQAVTFAGTLNKYTVSGQVKDSGGKALAGVTLALAGAQSATATSDLNGSYSFPNLNAGASYTVTASLANYNFAPTNQTFNNLSSNQTANFTASSNLYTISGRVVFGNNVGLPGVTVALTGGLSASTMTDSNGNFSFKSVPAVASYTVTPSLADFTFAPTSQSFDNLSSDKPAAFSAALVLYKIGGRVTVKGAGLPGVSVTLDAAHPLLGQRKAEAVTGADGSYSFNVEAGGDYTVTPSLKNCSFDRASVSFDGLRADGVADFAATRQTVFEFSAASYAVGEGAGSLDVTVTRAGDTSGTSTVSYSAQDATAQQGRDLSTVVGRLNFASGETSKSFKVFVTDDSFVEGAEELTLRLTPGAGAVAGAQSSATLTINDNDADASAPNPADETRFFVRQHYRDFLGREPDDAGLQFWTDNIEKCGTDQQCRAARRVDTSAAFFLSIEFKETGFLVHRAYVAAYGRAPRRVEEFLFDSRLIGDGVVVGQTGWEQRLEANKQAFFAEFVARDRFAAQYPLNLTPAQFVAALAAHTGGSLPAEEVSAAVAEFGAASDSADAAARARALRRVAESRALSERE